MSVSPARADAVPGLGVPADVLAFVLQLDLPVRLSDRRVLEGITPYGLTRYLTTHGWVRVERPDKISATLGEQWQADFWERVCAGEAISEVLVPRSVGRRDYLQRVAEAVGEIALALGRNKLAVVLEVRTASGAVNGPDAL